MNERELAKKLLNNEVCNNCVFHIPHEECVMTENYKSGTCNNWELKVYLNEHRRNC